MEAKDSAPKKSAAQKRREKKKRQQQNKQDGTASTPSTTSELATEEAKAPPARNENTDIFRALMSRPKPEKKKQMDDYIFWRTQPVPSLTEEISETGPFEPNKPVSEVKQEPYELLGDFTWSDINLDETHSIDEVYKLLTENYVEDDDCMFRFDYSKEFLLWALKPPGYRQDWHLGVRVKKSGTLVAFITAIPALIKVKDQKVKMVEINFLCIHKKLRSKRLAPVLIQEITRRVNLTGVFQAVYTAGVVLPKPVAKCRYYHRSLNPKKLVEVGFSHLYGKMTLPRLIRINKLPDKTVTPGLRPMQQKDVKAVTKLLQDYLETFELAPMFDEKEVAHWFLARDNVINTYVVADPVTGEVTDMTSFYTLPSTILKNPKHNILNAAYSFYSVSTKTPLNQLTKDALVKATELKYDVYNCLDACDNKSFIDELKFGPGDGSLQYYLFNWKCPKLESNKVGLVLM
eukprot:TRINITY_DN1199_c0_g1_i1.p1 TRINITY_DN1199_c0_g1~~TRINITY_DN1199_c0_g1_i1.p1  ORF type:complete len:460 (-),score=101.57 TRINITY_DN1199_c0_g1_i1:29-1408(-)